MSFLRLAFPAILLAAMAAFAAACGGSGDQELSLEEYLQRFDAIGEDAEARFDALPDPSEQEFASEEEQIAAFSAFFIASAGVYRDAVGALDKIAPPAEAKEGHAESAAVLTDGMKLVEDLAQQVQNVQTFSELEALFTDLDPEFTVLNDRGNRACFSLQKLADDNNIDIDLECENEEE